jgi:hypothetical protein
MLAFAAKRAVKGFSLEEPFFSAMGAMPCYGKLSG